MFWLKFQRTNDLSLNENILNGGFQTENVLNIAVSSKLPTRVIVEKSTHLERNRYLRFIRRESFIAHKSERSTNLPLFQKAIWTFLFIKWFVANGDIDEFNVYYILNPSTNSTRDAFHFTVLDPGKNKLSDQVFQFNWAWISFEKETYVINETDKYFVVTLSRRGYLGETAFVGVVVNDLTAKKDEDYESTYAKQVQFSPGQTESKWTLRILDDSVFENGETFEVQLTDPVMAAIEEPKKIFVTIRDEEDESSVYFEKSDYVVSEDVGELLVTIHRNGDINQEMAVVCSTDSKTATGTNPTTVQSYSDYISRPESYTSMVRFARKQKTGHCRVVIIDDALYEPDEVFQMRLTLPLGGRISKNLTTVTILSDLKDAPKLYFGESEYNVEENSGFLDVEVFRSGTDLTKASSVTVRSKPSDPITAEANQDYLGIGRTLDFQPGVSRLTIKVTIVDDIGHPVLEGPESFKLALSLPVNAALSQPNLTTITINDALSDAPSFQFKDSKYVVHENDKIVTTYVVRHGDVKQRASIRCYTRQMTAKVDEDFEERPNNEDSVINFEPGESEKVCSVVLVDDDLYENDEIFRLVLGNPRSSGAIRATIGVKNDTKILIKDLADRPVIRLEKTKLSAKEPEINELTNVEIAVVRTGDLTKTSVVRVHTKDGSAKSGIDYVPLSKELVFGSNISRLLFEVSILSDKEKEHRESFTVLLRPDKHMIAETQDTKAIIYIIDLEIVSDVTFPTKPIVVSLKDYDEVGLNDKTPIPGYPVICITACNPKHPEFPKTGPICAKEGINDSLSKFRWRVAAPTSQDGVTNDLYDLESATFFTDTHSITLDSIYYSPDSRVQCIVRAVNVAGDPGLESESIPITISNKGGLCLPRIEGAFGAEPFTAKMRYTEPDDPEHPNLIKLIVIIPHQDGMLPVLSTRTLSNFEFVLSPDGLRAGHHKCSNLLDYDEIHTKHGFLTNETKNINIVGEAEPYQFNQELRGEKTLRFYRNLDLEACIWEFTTYYDTSELVNECGGSISTDGQVLNLVQSFVSLKVPLYVSYVFHSPAATGGWQHSDLHSDLRLTFVYNTAILWQQGIGTTKESQLQGNLYPTAMNIGDDGRLVVHFRTKARFTGLFVLQHEDIAVSSMVMSPEQPGLTFKLKVLHTEPTYAQPEQTWQFQSDFSVRDYTGLYYIKLIPCTVSNALVYNEPHQCAPREPVTFDMHIRFQQVSDPVPAEFSLDTQFHLLRQRTLWLSNGTIGFGEESDASFVPGDTIYGRIMVNPVQNLGQSFHMTVEKCFLCTGVDGYIPKYDPENKEYGCVAESKKLLYAMKIIDKGAPHTVKMDFKSIPFNASLVEEDLHDDVIALKKQPGSDGFRFQSDPLFQVSYGRQWFIHCIYTVRSKENVARGIGKRSVVKHQIISTSRSKRELDLERVGNAGKGTNMHQIRLDYREIPKELQNGVYEIGGAYFTDSDQSLIPTLVGLAIVLLVILLVAIAVVRRKRRTRSRAVYAASTSATTVVVRHADKRPKVVIVASGYRANGNTEV